jgi:hypothetical protein
MIETTLAVLVALAEAVVIAVLAAAVPFLFFKALRTDATVAGVRADLEKVVEVLPTAFEAAGANEPPAPPRQVPSGTNGAGGAKGRGPGDYPRGVVRGSSFAGPPSTA